MRMFAWCPPPNSLLPRFHALTRSSTRTGNYDMVGNNTPVFFIRDPIKVRRMCGGRPLRLTPLHRAPHRPPSLCANIVSISPLVIGCRACLPA